MPKPGIGTVNSYQEGQTDVPSAGNISQKAGVNCAIILLENFKILIYSEIIYTHPTLSCYLNAKKI